MEVAFPARFNDLAPGRSRYLLALDEAGYVFDDGLRVRARRGGLVPHVDVGRRGSDGGLAPGPRRSLEASGRTSSTSRPSAGRSWSRGRSRGELLGQLTDAPLDADAFPPLGVREVRVAGVPCGAIRSGFVGEVCFELHHPRSRGPELWAALVGEGAAFGLRPHGLDALEILRLEKGHLYVGQDTLPDDTPAKLGLERAVASGGGVRGRPQRSSASPSSRSIGSSSASSSIGGARSSAACPCGSAGGSWGG